jgi:hypothetical protein
MRGEVAGQGHAETVLDRVMNILPWIQSSNSFERAKAIRRTV